MTFRSQLFDAFAGRPRPPLSRIVRPGTAVNADRLRQALAERTVGDISVHDLNAVFEGHLWMLTPEAFLYYLPALMDISLASYQSVSVFASELIGALTQPSRTDVEASLDLLQQLPPTAGLRDPRTADLLREQQLEWFDSGTPTRVFHERFDGVTATEGAAVLSFLEAFRDRHGANFPFGELDAAIGRYWNSFRS
jgi:hypothetical protein